MLRSPGGRDRVRAVDLPVVSLGIRAAEVGLIRRPVRNELFVTAQVDAIGCDPIDRFRRYLLEERVLSADVMYQGYCRRVGWHLVPGVF